MERFESANGVLGCKPRSRPAARWLASSPVRAPRRPLARGCFAGRSRPRVVASWRLVPHTPNRSPRPFPSPCRPARRALPCPYRASRARPACRSSPSVRKLSPVLPPKASGWHPLRCGGDSGPNPCTCGDLFRVPPPHLRSGFIFSFWGSPRVSEQRHRQKFS